jgi:predicted PurR-regulated permease PerM
VQGTGAAILALFLAFFIVKDADRIGGWLLDFVPRERRGEVRDVAASCWRALATYIRGVVFVATVGAVFIGLALLLVGVPLALPLIVLTWVGAFFPIVGAFVAGVVAVLVALVADGLTAALVVLAAIVVVQQLEGNVLYPVLVGPRLRLHPVAVLLSVTGGGVVAGIAGAFLAVPVATVVAVVLEHRRETRPAAPSVELPGTAEEPLLALRR